MSWLVEYTDEFGTWWDGLAETVQNDVSAVVELLIGQGPNLPFPHSSDVKGSRHGHMRELRVQSGGKPIRIFYAFDPRRAAILLIGGNKSGDKRFYVKMVPMADSLYDAHLLELRKERLIK
jgi:hypothetical protein